MENSSKIYIYQIIYRKEKNKRRVNSAKKRGRQWGMKGEKRKERRVGCGSVGKEGQVYRWKIRKDRVVRELTTRSRIGKWRCPILPVSDPTSTFGVRKLNFCVRYGNRWNLSAIITTMVIYQTIFGQTYTNYVLKHNVPLLRGHSLVNALPYLLSVSPV